ncbi:MAG: DUF6064 family protein [Roseateles sp.]|uniref:DUF6064 family protein n=1 Tax=Roseateles sp. TaxID=1971397 RepID=UPI004035F7AD
MSEWWTYRPSDFLLFSARTYWRLFELHNAQWWPLHVLALGLALAALWWRWRSGSARPLLLVTAAAWGFVAWAFHLQRYAGINWAAGWLAAAFAAQALLLLALAAARPQTHRRNTSPRAGIALMAAALLIYPFAGLAFGRPLAQAEVFGLAPDPTALATLGALLLTPAAPRLPWRLAWVVPMLWLALSGMTLWVMQAR